MSVHNSILLFNCIVLNQGSCRGNVRVLTKFDICNLINYRVYLIKKETAILRGKLGIFFLNKNKGIAFLLSGDLSTQAVYFSIQATLSQDKIVYKVIQVNLIPSRATNSLTLNELRLQTTHTQHIPQHCDISSFSFCKVAWYNMSLSPSCTSLTYISLYLVLS